MRKSLALGVAFFAASLLASTMAFGQVLYSEDFDTDSTSEWQFNASTVTDSSADFFFDYSAVGIPAAPGSETTRGMKLQANLLTGVFGGGSASPIGQSFTGSYVLSFYMWSNYSGGNYTATAHGLAASVSGATTLSYGGVGSSGTFANAAGAADGVFFAFTPDGQSASDFRAYSQERGASYQLPPLPPDSPDYCPNDCDLHADYLADSRNNSADLYRLNINPSADPVNSPNVGTVSAPTAQIDFANALSPPVDQTGFLPAGAMGFAWRHHEITVENDSFFTWTVDGTDLITIDGSAFNTPLGGSNIFFGTGDTNNGSPPPDYRPDLLAFTLVDNIQVSVLSEVTEDADFNGDGNVDGRDFLTWQRGFGTPDALLVDGDADGDMDVDGDDLVVWQDQYGGGALAAVTVPEPATLFSMVGAVVFLGLRRRK